MPPALAGGTLCCKHEYDVERRGGLNTETSEKMTSHKKSHRPSGRTTSTHLQPVSEAIGHISKGSAS